VSQDRHVEASPDSWRALRCELCHAAVGVDFCDRRWACALCAQQYYEDLIAQEVW